MLLRTHTCGELRDSHIGQTVRLNGWVNSYRDHGNLIFIDLRDRYGITQLVFDPDDGAGQEMMGNADTLRNEYVVAVEGKVRARVGGENPKLASGKVEIAVSKIEVLNKTENPPFLPDDMGKLPAEEFRMTYRYMDLRRPRMQQILGVRHKVYQVTRRYFDENGFLEVETPILYKSTPEGAREFLVPNRHVPGSWYALPQSRSWSLGSLEALAWRPVHADLPVFPRRGSACGPAGGVHADRLGDELRPSRPGGRDDGGVRASAVERGDER